MKSFLEAEDLDRLGFAILNLAKENWAVKERLLLLEDAVQRSGGLHRLDLDTVQPEGDLARLIDTERKRYVSSVLDAFKKSSVSPQLDD